MSTDNVTAITAARTPRKAPKRTPPPAHPFVTVGCPDETLTQVHNMLLFLAWHEIDPDAIPADDVAGKINEARYVLLKTLADSVEHASGEWEAKWKAERAKPAG